MILLFFINESQIVLRSIVCKKTSQQFPIPIDPRGIPLEGRFAVSTVGLIKLLLDYSALEVDLPLGRGRRHLGFYDTLLEGRGRSRGLDRLVLYISQRLVYLLVKDR